MFKTMTLNSTVNVGMIKGSGSLASTFLNKSNTSYFYLSRSYQIDLGFVANPLITLPVKITWNSQLLKISQANFKYHHGIITL